MCLKKYSAIGNSAIGNYVVLCSKLIQKTVLLEVSNEKWQKIVLLEDFWNQLKTVPFGNQCCARPRCKLNRTIVRAGQRGRNLMPKGAHLNKMKDLHSQNMVFSSYTAHPILIASSALAGSSVVLLMLVPDVPRKLLRKFFKYFKNPWFFENFL